MNPNRLEPQKKYFMFYFGKLKVLTYVGHHETPFRLLFWMDGSQLIQGLRYSHSFNWEYVEQRVWELSPSFEKFILLFT